MRVFPPRLAASLITICCLGLSASLARAESNGITASTCEACHVEQGDAEIELIPDPDPFEPGDEVAFTARVSAEGAVVGGLYVDTIGVGELRTVDGGGLTLFENQLTHFEPRIGEDGVMTFQFSWLVPNEAGHVRFAVRGLAADGDGTNAGDIAAFSEFDYVFGCEGQYFYYDADGDGYGSDSTKPLLACAGDPPKYYAEIAGDCSDTRASVNPDAEETCNQRDDDCDGEVDEDLEQTEFWSDADGDGYYNENTDEMIVGCTADEGYATEPGDCAPEDEDVHPGAPETCNEIDDDCDGDVDEDIPAECGVGACARVGPTCDVEDCVPGEPTDELCNEIDDDCNGEVDDGELCADGEVCVAGQCMEEEPGMGGSGGAAGAAGAAGAPSTQEPKEPASTAGAPTTPEEPEAPEESTKVGRLRGGGCRYAPSERGFASLILLSFLGLGLRARKRLRS